MTTLGQWWSGSEFELFATDEAVAAIGNENSIAVCNHRYDIDWLVALMFCQRVGLLGVIKKCLLFLLPIIQILIYYLINRALKLLWKIQLNIFQ